LRAELMGLGRADAGAFDAVLKARRMPQTSADEVVARERAVAAAELEATRVPLKTAMACVEVVELAGRVARDGNPNAVSDAGVAGRLAAAAAEGAMLNVQINLKTLAPCADKNDVEKELPRLQQALDAASRKCADAVRDVMDA